MGELESLIRKIVRDEVHLYLKELNDEVDNSNDHQQEKGPSSSQREYELFEKKYQAALKIDDEVHQKYQAQTEVYGQSVTLEKAAQILNMSKYAIRKLSKTDPNFPGIFRGSIVTTRLMHWLDGGKAYWKLSDDSD